MKPREVSWKREQAIISTASQVGYGALLYLAFIYRHNLRGLDGIIKLGECWGPKKNKHIYWSPSQETPQNESDSIGWQWW